MVAQCTPKVREAPDESDKKTGSVPSAATASHLRKHSARDRALKAVALYETVTQTCRHVDMSATAFFEYVHSRLDELTITQGKLPLPRREQPGVTRLNDSAAAGQY